MHHETNYSDNSDNPDNNTNNHNDDNPHNIPNRRGLRHEESKTENALTELSSLTNSAPSQADIQIEDRLLEIFANRRQIIDTMARLLDNDPSGGGA